MCCAATSPEWLTGGFAWSQPFLPHVEVVITNRTARPAAYASPTWPASRSAPCSAIAYPDLERALGKGFVRADGPSSELNLRKLALGRLQHMVTIKDFVDYRLKLGDPALSLHPPLVVNSHMTALRGVAEGPRHAGRSRPRGGADRARGRRRRHRQRATNKPRISCWIATFSTKYSVSPKQALGTPLCWA